MSIEVKVITSLKHFKFSKKMISKRCLSGPHLRLLMKKVPSTVVVITIQSNSLLRGITCSSFTSVSLTPPIISFAINNKSTLIPELPKHKQFAINILSKDQLNHSLVFSSPRTHGDFSNIDYFMFNSTPVLQGCLGNLICNVEKTIQVGDHYVCFGRVKEVVESLGAQSTSPLEPLLYYQSSYRSIGDELFIDAFQSQRLSYSDWTHRAHVR